jgi:hypothetical protein
MSGSGGFGFVIDMRTLAIAAAVVIAIVAVAWVVFRR